MVGVELDGALLGAHVAAGVVGLVLALPVLLARKGGPLHVVLGRVYVGAAVVLSVTALGLVVLDPGLVGLGVVAVLTLGWALGGLFVARRRPQLRGGWLVWHLNLMGSSVIAFVTGFAVQTADGHVLAWILPTIVGSPIIARRSAAGGSSRRGSRRSALTPPD